MIQVGNLKAGARGIYIGRALFGRKGSPLGNPFRMANEADRPAVIAKYRDWLRTQIESGNQEVLRELRRLQALHLAGESLVLVCYCKPLACHGDVIKEVLEGRPEQFA